MTDQTTPSLTRTPAKRKARQLARYLRGERPDYAYLKEVFRHLRAELDIEVPASPRSCPTSPPKPRSAATTTPCGPRGVPPTSC
jgi:hypothetical protein